MKIHYVVLNLRMGGQLSSIVSLVDLLRARGVQADVVLPSIVPSASKQDLAAFGARPVQERAAATWEMLRRVVRSADPQRDIIHLVVPSPSFASAATLLLPFPLSRVIVQYEGAPTRLDAPHLQAFRDDPQLMLPRLILNNGAWAQAARLLPCAHLATFPALARWLREQGFARVFEVANVAALNSADDAPLPVLDALPHDATTIAYVGHCHPVKGVDDLLAAWELAAPRRPDLQLLLALSPDGDRARIEARVDALPVDVKARVTRLGIIPIASLLRRLDALALPYRTIATTTVYPSLLLEAVATDCPLLLGAVDELKDLVEPGTDRVTLLPPGDVLALTDALVRLPRRHTLSSRPAFRLPDNAARVDALLSAYAALSASPGRAP